MKNKEKLIVVHGHSIVKNSDQMIKSQVQTLSEIFDIDLYFLGKTSNRYEKLFEESDNIKFKPISNEGFKNAYEFVCHVKKIAKKEVKNKKVVILTPQQIKGYKENDYENIKNVIRCINYGDEIEWNYSILKSLASRYIIMLLFAKESKECYNLVADPQQVAFSNFTDYIGKKVVDGYILNKKRNKNSLTYIPFYEYALLKNNEKLFKESKAVKEVVFTCYMISVSKEREWIKNFEKMFKGIKDIDVCIITKENKKKPIVQKEYYKKIINSKYTMIIPPYDKDSFSMIRFFESVQLNCLPFIYKKCNLNEVYDTFPQIASIMEEKLYLGGKEIKNIIKNHKEYEKFRLDTIKEIKSTKDWKNVESKEFLSKYWKIKGR